MASCAPKSLSSASSVDTGDVTPEPVRQRVYSRITSAAAPHLFGFDMIANVAEADEHARTAKKYIYEQERLIERLADEENSCPRRSLADKPANLLEAPAS